MIIEKSFKGFSIDSIAFLVNLRNNNNKAWFEENRDDYIKCLLTPLKSLASDMSSIMLDIDPMIETMPAVGKTISRVHRDIRFSKDKSPYRSNLWITFKRPSELWTDAPSYFFEIFPDMYRFGMGFYSASKEIMDIFRRRIDINPREFKQVISFYDDTSLFALEGDKYKRLLNENISLEILEWYQRKSFYLVCNKKIDSHLFSNLLVEDLKNGFIMLSPLYHYLQNIRSYVKER